jgi:hypothetical protein
MSPAAVRAYANVVSNEVNVVLAELRRRFPRAVVWFGASTFRWWALVPPCGEWRLIEAVSPAELARALDDVEEWPWLPRL